MYLERRILIRKGSKSLYDYCQEHPDKLYLLEEWDYEKNENLELTPKTISYSCKQKAWWILSYNDPTTNKHFNFEWQATIASRVNGLNCPYLSNQAVWQGFNDLATRYPEIAAEWHPTKNGDLKPSDILAGGYKEYWWQCKFGHEFKSVVRNRIKSCGCPECSLKGTSIPELALYFYLSKAYSDTIHRHKFQNIEFDIYIPLLNLAIEYDGFYYHKDKLERDNLKDEFCKKHGIRLIRLRSEKLTSTKFAETLWIDESSYNKISKAIIGLFNYLDVKYNFEINIDEDYTKLIETKTLEIKENSLTVKYPELAAEWHPTKNGNLTPDKITSGSDNKVWWQCSKNPKHEWQTRVIERVNGNNCPYCSNKKILIGENDLVTTHPHLVKEWDYKSNYPLLPTQVVSGSNKSVYWICPTCNHKYSATIRNRSFQNLGCPSCNGRLAWSEEEIKILKECYLSEGPKIKERLPNRTIYAIKKKAKELNLTGPQNWTKEEIEILREYYPIEGKDVIKRLPNRNHKAIQIKVSRLGIKYKGDL